MKNKIGELLFNIEYYCWDKPKMLYYNIKNYVSNRILFNKVLWNWRAWDAAYQVDLFKFGLEQLCKCIEDGYEETVSRMKKVEAIKQLIAELNRDIDDEVYKVVYGDDADNMFTTDENGIMQYNVDEAENQKLHNKYRELSNIEHKKHLDKIFRIIRGQKVSDIEKLQNALIEKLSPEEKAESKKQCFYKQWAEAFDGTGIYGWWD